MNSAALQAPPAQLPDATAELRELSAGLWHDEPASSHAADDTLPGGGALVATKAKTKQDKAREARRKAQAESHAAKATLKAQRRDVDNAAQLAAEVEQDEAARARRRQRRQVWMPLK